MQISFMVDFNIDNQVRACVRLSTFSSQWLLTGFLPNFTGMFLKNFSSPLQKNQVDMVDFNIDNQVRACVRLSTFSSQWLLTGFLPNFTGMFLKNFSSPLQKNQACGAIQALKRL